MKRNKNFWSYRLHKLGTPKVLRTDRRTDGQTDGRSGPITRPAFAKATQVKIPRKNLKLFAPWENFHAFLSSAELFHFFFFFFEKIFQEYQQSVKQFISRSFWMFVRLYLGSNCLQNLSADGISKYRAKIVMYSSN